MDMTVEETISVAGRRASRATRLNRLRGFTLVELLVVITIIGILAALITTAAIGALRKARETEIKTEINQIDTGFEEYKNRTTAYPPNCQTDGSEPLDESAVFSDLKHHLKRAFPRQQEPDDLLRCLVGLTPSSAANFRRLPGGMSGGEAIVFWLGGFSSDPKFPISGEGGPSYRIDNLEPGVAPNEADPIESRRWVFPFAVGRLAPRNPDGFFDDSTNAASRYIEYEITINGEEQQRRINFWQYAPRKSEQPYLYFDTSRYAPATPTDPPAATEDTLLGPEGNGLHVHAFKKLGNSPTTPAQYINPDKFQIIHCGIDEEWDVAAFERMSMHPPIDYANFLYFPEGPFVGEIADTITNFASETRIEDAQP
jgi:prepilin-type N-terminal cleavage/methylation domain-containing protein